MSKRNKIYGALILASFGALVFVSIKSKLLDSKPPILDFLETFFTFMLFFFATLWRKNRAQLIGLLFLSIELNLELFRKVLSGWNEHQIIQNSFWPIGIICYIAVLIAIIIGLSKEPKLVYWTKGISINNSTIVLYLIGEIVLFQMIIKFF